jgi:hypothetical protein
VGIKEVLSKKVLSAKWLPFPELVEGRQSASKKIFFRTFLSKRK